ncbi:TPA: hypothetical protein N0F65_004254 [Lagenidium giganteum]|uniref:PH domain-containing protein n=1 Tax=Lagenidium giganteum TaxID=4803 RepID=A0AAV2ZCY5_9STRA|nr:TPA: hypothetical protein N0F65_004254 [Lagenidium giganteum]
MLPKLKVSESGKFQDQFYHAHNGSRAMGVLKNRTYLRKGDKKDYVKRKSSMGSGKDEEQFSDSDIVFAGYLIKQGSFWKSWRRRYFILRRDIPILAYYSSMENLTKLGEITIDGTTTVAHDPDATFADRFVVEHDGRKLVLVPEDGRHTMETWMLWINNCINKRANEATGRPSLERNSLGNNTIQLRLTGNGSLIEKERVLSRRNSPHVMGFKRNATDTTLIQQAQADSLAERESSDERTRFLRTSRRTSIEAYNKGKPPAPSPPKPKLYRSYSASSVLSTRSTDFEPTKVHDDCGLIKLQRGNHSASKLDTTPAQTRARCLSLPSFKPAPSIELAISVSTKGAQEAAHMAVVLSCIIPGRDSVELCRTEMQGCLSLRACGGDMYARDFNALLSVPLSVREMLHFEVFSMVNTNTESLTVQQSLGFVRISPVDLLFSRDSTLLLECRRPSSTSQVHFLVLDRIVPNESLNLGHSYTYAKRHFIADTARVEKRKSSSPEMQSSSAGLGSVGGGAMARGKFDSQDANHLFVSEELSSSYCSISVAVAYMKMVQSRNKRHIHDSKRFTSDIEKKYEQAPSSPCNKTQSSQTINLHAEMVRDMQARLAHYSKLYETYVSCEEFYTAMLAMLEEGKEPGITGCLKRSTQKKDKMSEFMPTNLNCHVIRAKRVILSSGHPAGAITPSMDTSSSGTGAASDELVHAVITHGCTAAHTLGFKEGGLRRLQQMFAQTGNDQRLLEKIVQRQDIVRCQALAVTAAAFLSVVGLAANKSANHMERLRLICATGFLVSTESLLSTVGAEKGMLEDMVEGVQWLSNCVSLQVVQSMEVNPLLKCSKCVGVTSNAAGDQVVATFAVPPEVFAMLPPHLQQGNAVKVFAVLFTQGINEMQSVANTMLDTRLQDEINHDSVQTLQRYFVHYETQVRQIEGDGAAQRNEEMDVLKADVGALFARLYEACKSQQKKNVNILLESSDICRRLGAGRTTCCKSGKDRTAMSVTLEASRLLVDHFGVKQGVQLCTAMRERGVRRVNVLVNTGKDKYAFNSLQLKYLPDCYKPPIASADSKVAS